MNETLLRELPSVEELAALLAPEYPGVPRRVINDEVRAAIAAVRTRLREGAADAPAAEVLARHSLQRLLAPSLRRVINATGVILHTNLGRAPLGARQPIHGYSNLEYELSTGRRGKRDTHIAPLLLRLLGKPGIAVNNNAAAVWLALNELAAGQEVIVSRGELIEIGDGFRIPDIMARSGAMLREVGTTNRTRLEDYREAINDRTRLLMRVHPSNFHMTGFTGRPTLSELAELGRERSIPVYEDLGSGCLVDLKPYGIEEPLAADSLRQGANLITFSGDKLLGGPQAGLIAGDPDLVQRCRRNPMFRALRVDKLIYQNLEATLAATYLEQWEVIPTLAMIRMPLAEIKRRAESLASQLPAEVIEGRSLVGGGSTPDQSLPTYLVAVDGDASAMERMLRQGNPPVIVRIADDRLLLDLRTVAPEDDSLLLDAFQQKIVLKC